METDWHRLEREQIRILDSEADLRKVFLSIVDCFNNQQWDPQLLAFLDQNVRLNKVNVKGGQPNAIVGVNNVINYLKSITANNQYNPPFPEFQPYASTMNVSVQGKHGWVTGTAHWHDNDGDADGSIHYSFTFSQQGQNWILKSLYGSAD